MFKSNGKSKTLVIIRKLSRVDDSKQSGRKFFRLKKMEAIVIPLHVPRRTLCLFVSSPSLHSSSCSSFPAKGLHHSHFSNNCLIFFMHMTKKSEENK